MAHRPLPSEGGACSTSLQTSTTWSWRVWLPSIDPLPVPAVGPAPLAMPAQAPQAGDLRLSTRPSLSPSSSPTPDTMNQRAWFEPQEEGSLAQTAEVKVRQRGAPRRKDQLRDQLQDASGVKLTGQKWQYHHPVVFLPVISETMNSAAALMSVPAPPQTTTVPVNNKYSLVSWPKSRAREACLRNGVRMTRPKSKHQCEHCGAQSSPAWRRGPVGWLCNRCGLKYHAVAKSARKDVRTVMSISSILN